VVVLRLQWLAVVVAWAVVIGACRSPAPVPPDLPLVAGPIDRPGTTATQLDRLPASWSLPAGNLPGARPVEDRWELSPDLAAGARASFPLPFNPGPSADKFAPPGVSVSVGGTAVAWEGRGPAGGWSIERGQLQVTAPRAAGGPVEVHHSGLRAAVQRLEFGASNLHPEVFVRRSHTLGGETRAGLMVPAPGVGAWSLTLPSGARFEAFPAMIAPELAQGGSDGASIVLSVEHEGVSTEAGRRSVSGKTSRFDRWTVDLSAWAGRAVTLRITTEPGRTPDYDYVFVGAPAIHGDRQEVPRRVVVIGIDTTRPDHFGTHGYTRPTTPALDQFAERAAVFERAWTPAPRTRPSFRSATTGRLPLDAVGAVNLGAIMSGGGFATAGIVANIHLHARFGFHEGFDLWWQDTGARAADQGDRALDWLKQNEDRDTYLFLHIMDPHLFYDAPSPYGSMFVSDPDPELPAVYSRGEVYGWMRKGVDDRRKQHIIANYDGELAYTSEHLGRFLHELDAMNSPTLVVVHSDHGEEFWEHGAFEHNHSLYEEVVHGLLWVRPPGGRGARVTTPVMLADIAPTVVDYAGITTDVPFDGRSLRPLIDGVERGDEPHWERPIPSAYLRYGHERWGIVWKGHKYILHTRDGAEELYDLTADPDERKNLADSTPLDEWRAQLAAAHRVPVGPGWRLTVKLTGADPLQIRLPAPARAAAILDPETLIESPVNQEWGERPPLTVADIGAVTLSEGGSLLTFTPGPRPQGTVVVMFEEPVSPEGAQVVSVDPPVSLGRRWGSAGRTVSTAPGTVLMQPPSEVARMRQTDAAGASEIDLLKQLGYIQ
jgi:arylsulfatase A-like enzyme